MDGHEAGASRHALHVNPSGSGPRRTGFSEPRTSTTQKAVLPGRKRSQPVNKDARLAVGGPIHLRPLALATAARCRGLVAFALGDPPGALAHLQSALERHEKVPQPFELGRTLLVAGRMQRRMKQKTPRPHHPDSSVDHLRATARSDMGRTRPVGTVKDRRTRTLAHRIDARRATGRPSRSRRSHESRGRAHALHQR